MSTSDRCDHCNKLRYKDNTYETTRALREFVLLGYMPTVLCRECQFTWDDLVHADPKYQELRDIESEQAYFASPHSNAPKHEWRTLGRKRQELIKYFYSIAKDFVIAGDKIPKAAVEKAVEKTYEELAGTAATLTKELTERTV